MARAGVYVGEADDLQGRIDKLQVPLCPLCGLMWWGGTVRVGVETDSHREYWGLAEL